MEEDYETEMTDRAYFLGYSLKGDPSQYYNLLLSQDVGWNVIMKSLNARYFSEDKRDEI